MLGQSNLALIGLVAGVVFFASTLGQLVQGRLPSARRLPLGCAILIIGAALIGLGIALAMIWVFLGGALIAGFGQGIGFRAGMGAIAAASPADQRGSVTSTFFVVVYVALSIPVVGIGLVSRSIGLAPTGVGFAAFVALLSAVALVLLLRRPAQA